MGPAGTTLTELISERISNNSRADDTGKPVLSPVPNPALTLEDESGGSGSEEGGGSLSSLSSISDLVYETPLRDFDPLADLGGGPSLP